MPLSTVLGAQSLVQPAVCTTATRPASPYTGQAIYDTTISALLIWSGTAWTGTGGLQLVTTATCSSGGTAVGGVVTIGSAVSSVTVATAFSATYDNYKVIISGGASSATCFLRLTLGATATGYYAGIWDFNYLAGTGSTGQANTAFWLFGNGTVDGLSASGEIVQPFLSDQTTFNSVAPSQFTTGEQRIAGGYLANTTSYTAFTITPSTGTLTGGTIRVYGYQNS